MCLFIVWYPLSSADFTIFTPLLLELSYTVWYPLYWGKFSICALRCSYSKSLQFSFLIPSGTHHCCVDRGSVICMACPTTPYMAGSIAWTPVTHPSTNRAGSALLNFSDLRELATTRSWASYQLCTFLLLYKTTIYQQLTANHKIHVVFLLVYSILLQA